MQFLIGFLVLAFTAWIMLGIVFFMNDIPLREFGVTKFIFTTGGVWLTIAGTVVALAWALGDVVIWSLNA